jgi:hypothetical protein
MESVQVNHKIYMHKMDSLWMKVLLVYTVNKESSLQSVIDENFKCYV